MTKETRLLRVTVPCVAIMQLAACGGGSPGNSSNVTTYNVSATAGAGGSISPSSVTVNATGTTTFTVTPNSGYAISSVTGCGGSLSGGTYTTGAINANCTVTASFVAQYTVAATAGTGGSISPSSATVNAAGTTTFTVTPNSGYVIGGVTGCGGSLSGSTYTTGAINANCTVTASFAAAFTWVSGSNTVNAPGVYGTQGVAAATNVPGARDGGVTWTDTSGNLWMYGGFGGFQGAPTAAGNFFSDLWKYSPSSGQWTWVGGLSTQNTVGVYGTQGVAAPANTPGARSNEVRWMDASGNLWLFGGGGYGYDSTNTFAFGFMNDLWKYSPSSGEWTWVGGSSTLGAIGSYGTQGVASATNIPGARDAAISWTDASGDVWLFGGVSGGPRNDLWKYSPSSGEWTWVGGPNTPGASGVYGTQGVAAANNMPGARYAGVSWTDAGSNMWLFGGYGYDAAGTLGYLNDLWKYSPSSGQWTWVSGSSTVGAKGSYGTQGVAAATNVPGARADRSSTWTDASGNLWLFGSDGYDATGTFGSLNDLWKYSPSSGQWTWVGGSSTANAVGLYGSQGVAAVQNVPGARGEPVSWTDRNGNLWLFGGFQQGASNATRVEMNDLWKYPTQ